jgi:hypothetical protein
MGTVVIGKVISGDSVFLDDDEQPFLTGGACLLDGIFVWLLVFCITDGDYVTGKKLCLMPPILLLIRKKQIRGK